MLSWQIGPFNKNDRVASSECNILNTLCFFFSLLFVPVVTIITFSNLLPFFWYVYIYVSVYFIDKVMMKLVNYLYLYCYFIFLFCYSSFCSCQVGLFL